MVEESATSQFEAEPQGETHFTSMGLVGAVALFCLVVGWYFVLSNMRLGFDVSDTAYYVLSIFRHSEIDRQITLFGPVWDALSPFNTIMSNRYFGFAFLAVTTAVPGWLLSRHILKSDGRILPGMSVFFALACAPMYYFLWLPDPSYNMMTIGFLCLLLSGFSGLLILTSPSRPKPNSFIEFGLSFVIGFVMTALVFTKISSAAAAGLLMLAGFALLRWRSLNPARFFRLATGCATGIAALLACLATVGIGPLEAFVTMSKGYELSSLMVPFSLSPVGKLVEYFNYLIINPFFSHISTLMLYGTVGAAFALRSTRHWQKVRIPVLAALALSSSYLVFDLLNPMKPRLWVEVFNGTYVSLIVYTLLCLLFSRTSKSNNVFVVWVALVLTPLVYMFGTGNAWSAHIAGAMAIVLIMGNFGAMAMGPQDYPIFAVPVLGFLVLCGVVTVNQITFSPYRMNVPLSELTHAAEVGPDKEILYHSQDLATFYKNLLPAQKTIATMDRTPLVIDMTGRAPIVAFQLGAKIPRVPWLLSGYPGSIAVLDRLLASFDVSELRRAWILEAEGMETGFPRESLNRYGLDFPNGYDAIAQVPIPYMDTTATLYAPRLSASN